MNADSMLTRALESLREPLPPDESLVPGVLARLDRLPSSETAFEKRSTAPRPAARRWLGRAGVAVAAAVAVALLVLFGTHTPPLTLAEVTAAVDKQHWAHLVYRDGSETWVCLDDGKFLMKLVRDSQPTFYLLRDPATHTEQRFDSLGEIHLSRPNVWVLGRNRNGKIIPLEVDELTFSDKDLSQPARTTEEERSKLPAVQEFEIVPENGRKLGHFTELRRDALGELRISKELWVDFATKLPVRIRTWGFAAGKWTKREPREGTYHFVEKGPVDLYDLGVPRTVPIVPQIESDEDAKRLIPATTLKAIDGAKEAVRRFPHRFRVLTLDGGMMTITYVDSGESHPFDWVAGDEEEGAVDRYFWADCQNADRTDPKFFALATGPANDLAVPIPADEMAKKFPLKLSNNTVLIDGRRWFRLTRTSFDPPKSRLQVLNASSALDADALESQWEFASWNWTELATGKSIEAVPAGQILVHAERSDFKNDWFIDPARDYTVARHIRYDIVEGKWRKFDTRAVKWERLPDGPWYVAAWETRWRTKVTRADEQGNTSQQEEDFVDLERLVITPLEPKDFPVDIFDGDKFLESAKEVGAEIRVE